MRTSPWRRASQRGTVLGSGYEPLLIAGPVGSLPIECAKEIHSLAGGGTFESVTCTPDSSALRTQVFGATSSVDEEYSLFDPDPPIGAVHRAATGTLFFGDINRSNPVDADWLRTLFARQPTSMHGRKAQLDAGTRVIASTTNEWADKARDMLLSWMGALFGERVVTLDLLGSRPGDVWEAIQWFSRQLAQDFPHHDLTWSREAKELMLEKQWPGGYQELRSVVHSMMSSTEIGGTIGADICQRVLNNHDRTGMKPVDLHRRQDCGNYAQGMVYMGRQISGNDIYDWIEQFSKLAVDRKFDPWSVALQIVRQISHRYYYSSERLRILVRDAYSALCGELSHEGLLPNGTPSDPDGVPRLKALLINPLGPVKSAAGMVPHVAHLLGAGTKQQVAPLDEVGKRLSKNEDIQVVLFCDDFAGTGQQIANNVVDTLADDSVFQEVCQDRINRGKRIALGIVLAVGFDDALSRIRTSGPVWLPTFVHAGERLESCDRVFSDTSRIFPDPEIRGWAKALMVDQIGSHLSPKWPGGFGDLQALVITSDNAPNDTLPAVCMTGVVHGMTWKALFKRASSPSV